MEREGPNHGRSVKAICWPDSGTECGRMLQASETYSLIYEETYLGDRTECWFVGMVDGIEVARHNAKFVESIIWAT